MEILLAVAVAVVSVASLAMAARFRASIRDNAAGLDEVKAELARQGREQALKFEEMLKLQGENSRRAWSNAVSGLRVQVKDAQAGVDQAIRHTQALLAEQDRKASSLQADLRAEVGQRVQEIQGLHAHLQGEAHQRREAIKEVRAELQQEILRHRDLSKRLELDLRTKTTRYAQDLEHLRAAAHAAEAGATAASRSLADVQRQLGDLRRREERWRAGCSRDISYLDRHLSAIREHVRRQFADAAATSNDSGQRVLAGGIYAGQAAAAEVLPAFYEAFCLAASLEIVFREPRSGAVSRFYLGWESPDGAPADHHLERLLRACPDRTSQPLPGVKELRDLVLAVHNAEPAALQIGPMVIARAGGRLLGTILTAADAPHIDPHAAKSAEMLLGSLPSDHVVELSSWADHYGPA